MAYTRYSIYAVARKNGCSSVVTWNMSIHCPIHRYCEKVTKVLPDDHSDTDTRSTAFSQDNQGKLAPERRTILDLTKSKRRRRGKDGHQLDNMQVICTLRRRQSTSSLRFYRPKAHADGQRTV